MYSFGEQIKKIRKKYNLSQEEFAEILNEEADKFELETNIKVKPDKGFKKGVISRWENNIVDPRMDIIRLISRAFNIGSDVLLGIADEEVSNVYQTEVVNVPLVGTIAAGEPIFSDNHIESYIPVVASSLKKNNVYFYLTVKGDSMNLEFSSGSKVLIEKGNNFSSGDIVALRVNGDDLTVKKVVFDERSITVIPMSLNPIYVPRTYYKDEIEIFIEGKVIQSIKEY